jgi:hypothetical protein
VEECFTGSNLIELFKSRSMVENLLALVKHKEKNNFFSRNVY